MNKHTPGPWKDTETGIAITSSKNLRICTLNCDEALFSKSERKANAILISLAPCLRTRLDAVEGLAHTWEQRLVEMRNEAASIPEHHRAYDDSLTIQSEVRRMLGELREALK